MSNGVDDDDGGGVFIQSGSNAPSIDSCSFLSCTAREAIQTTREGGGGIILWCTKGGPLSSLTFISCATGIINDVAGGGLYDAPTNGAHTKVEYFYLFFSGNIAIHGHDFCLAGNPSTNPLDKDTCFTTSSESNRVVSTSGTTNAAANTFTDHSYGQSDVWISIVPQSVYLCNTGNLETETGCSKIDAADGSELFGSAVQSNSLNTLLSTTIPSLEIGESIQEKDKFTIVVNQEVYTITSTVDFDKNVLLTPYLMKYTRMKGISNSGPIDENKKTEYLTSHDTEFWLDREILKEDADNKYIFKIQNEQVRIHLINIGLAETIDESKYVFVLESTTVGKVPKLYMDYNEIDLKQSKFENLFNVKAGGIYLKFTSLVSKIEYTSAEWLDYRVKYWTVLTHDQTTYQYVEESILKSVKVTESDLEITDPIVVDKDLTVSGDKVYPNVLKTTTHEGVVSPSKWNVPAKVSLDNDKVLFKVSKKLAMQSIELTLEKDFETDKFVFDLKEEAELTLIRTKISYGQFEYKQLIRRSDIEPVMIRVTEFVSSGSQDYKDWILNVLDNNNKFNMEGVLLYSKYDSTRTVNPIEINQMSKLDKLLDVTYQRKASKEDTESYNIELKVSEEFKDTEVFSIESTIRFNGFSFVFDNIDSQETTGYLFSVKDNHLENSKISLGMNMLDNLFSINHGSIYLTSDEISTDFDYSYKQILDYRVSHYRSMIHDRVTYKYKVNGKAKEDFFSETTKEVTVAQNKKEWQDKDLLDLAMTVNEDNEMTVAVVTSGVTMLSEKIDKLSGILKTFSQSKVC